jgi:hypothetical protein
MFRASQLLEKSAYTLFHNCGDPVCLMLREERGHSCPPHLFIAASPPLFKQPPSLLLIPSNSMELKMG